MRKLKEKNLKMHFSDDDMQSISSANKRYVWGRIRQVQSDSDTKRPG